MASVHADQGWRDGHVTAAEKATLDLVLMVAKVAHMYNTLYM